MIAIPAVRSVDSQDRFVEMLPLIQQQAFCAFRSRHPETRRELIQEVIANAYVAYARLVELGRQSLAYPTPLAGYAIRQVLAGRRVGTKMNVHDVMSPANRKVAVEHFSRFEDETGEWREALVEDRRSGPAETAAARLDIAAWLRSLPTHRRRIARVLSTGESTTNAAKKYRVSPARISQVRRELRESWQEFLGEPVAI